MPSVCYFTVETKPSQRGLAFFNDRIIGKIVPLVQDVINARAWSLFFLFFFAISEND